MSPAPDPSSVRADGPWKHRDISANGISQHVAEIGEGDLVLLLHGFAEYWWVWHHQMVCLAEAGYRVVAADLRGYGDTDKPPRGYDAWTIAGDISGLVRALGAARAHVVGHGWGGSLAWTTATLRPRVVQSLTVFGGAHPLALRSALPRGIRHPDQRAATRHMLWCQLPLVPERALIRDGAANVERYLREWSGRGWTSSPEFDITAAKLRAAFQIPGVAHSSLEYYRWAFRSRFRGDGRRFRDAVDHRCDAPVMQVHGTADTCVLPLTARESARWAGAGSAAHELPGIGHYPHLEAPDTTVGLLLDWFARHR